MRSSAVNYLSECNPEVFREERVEHRVDAAVHVGEHVGHDLGGHREVRDVVLVQSLHQQNYLKRNANYEKDW